MLAELIIRDTDAMNQFEIEEECRELEDAYAEALRDDVAFDALNRIWTRIQELQKALDILSGRTGRLSSF